MILSKSRDFWFTLIAVVGPDAAEFFLVNGAVFCRLQLALNLSQKSSHPTPPQSIPKVTYNPEKGLVTGCMLPPEPLQATSRQSADQTAPLAGLEFIAGVLIGETN